MTPIEILKNAIPYSGEFMIEEGSLVYNVKHISFHYNLNRYLFHKDRIWIYAANIYQPDEPADEMNSYIQNYLKQKTMTPQPNPTQSQYAVMVEGKSSPAKLYDNYRLAELEAIRLCKKEQLVAYVLKVVAKVETNDVKVTRFDNRITNAGETITVNDPSVAHRKCQHEYEISSNGYCVRRGGKDIEHP